MEGVDVVVSVAVPLEIVINAVVGVRDAVSDGENSGILVGLSGRVGVLVVNGVKVLLGVFEMVGAMVIVGVSVGVPVQVVVRVIVDVSVSVNVGVKVIVPVVEGVNVNVFSTGWNGVKVGKAMNGAATDSTEMPVTVGMKGRNGAISGGSTHPARSSQHNINNKINRPFIWNPRQSYMNSREGLHTILKGDYLLTKEPMKDRLLKEKC